MDELYAQGNLAAARAVLTEGIARLEDLGFLIDACQTLPFLCQLEIVSGDYENALRWIEKNAEISRRIGIAVAELVAFEMRAKTERSFGHWQRAEEACRGALETARSRHSEARSGNFRSALGQILVETGKIEEARSLLAPRLKHLKESYSEEKNPYTLFPIAVLLAGNARVMLANHSGGQAPAQFAGGVFDFLDRKCHRADPRYFPPEPDEWDAIEGVDWVRPWLVNWYISDRFATRHVFRGLIRELRAAFDKDSLAALMNEGKEAGLDAVVEECIRLNA